MSQHSRNYQCGVLIGQGLSPDQAVKEVGMVVEGFYTTQVYERAHDLSIDMPITQSIYRILKEGLSAEEVTAISCEEVEKKKNNKKEFNFCIY